MTDIKNERTQSQLAKVIEQACFIIQSKACKISVKQSKKKRTAALDEIVKNVSGDLNVSPELIKKVGGWFEELDKKKKREEDKGNRAAKTGVAKVKTPGHKDKCHCLDCVELLSLFGKN